MHLLPARLVELCVEVLHVGLSRVPGVVLAEGAEQDERDDAGEEEDHHEGVEDGEPVDLVLEEVVVEVAVEALREGRLSLRPLDRVRQVDLCARMQRDRVLRRQVDLDNARAVVRDREPLVREEERLGLRLVLVAVRGGELAHHPPDGKVVEVPLVPVVIVNRKAELSCALLVQHHGADLGVVGHRLAEAQLEAARDEVVPLQHFAEPVVPVLQLLDWKAAAKR
mmetsp:Transcript_14260/g.45696  ORF Transcript_14260/g.45696 Transcript_14260/m.45696 type:complete len:224 (-) Transcript_14260:173-844(-)